MMTLISLENRHCRHQQQLSGRTGVIDMMVYYWLDLLFCRKCINLHSVLIFSVLFVTVVVFPPSFEM